ncbi:MAG: hypothetical protein GXZ13_06660 [Synergistaceae bacterium]|jgi:hypothetical protein|nr:hypothetical protein [Synergistaceae bacterium]
MKKIILVLILFLAMSSPVFAAFGSKGVIPGADPVEYRGLKITSEGVNIVIVNRSENKVTFSAACVFVGQNNKNLGDFFIEKITLEPLGHIQLTKLYLKGDVKLSRKAEYLRWTVYTLEEK